MAFAVPIAALMLLLGFGLLVLRFRVVGRIEEPLCVLPVPGPMDRRAALVVAVFVACVALWLTEPLHGVPAGVTALGASAALFGSGLLGRADLAAIDWSTLLLIAGGIVLGRLLEVSGLLEVMANGLDVQAIAPLTLTLLVVSTSALLSALMSNTATATMLIPLASTFAPSPTMAVLIAIGCSLGCPFVVSTPPNAMVYGAGARSSDLLVIGLPLMLLGCAVVSSTGVAVLEAFGIR
jgi:solute carrier family 13 (sodium-dependent dicarboxylate transporter), member 2/3/5